MFPRKISRSWSDGQVLDRILGMDDDGDAVQGDHAIRSGVKPLALACLISFGSMARDDSAMSQVPLIRAVMPVPGPAAGDGDVDAGLFLVERLGPGLARG